MSTPRYEILVIGMGTRRQSVIAPAGLICPCKDLEGRFYFLF